MWAIEDSPGPKAADRGGGIILPPAILLDMSYVSCRVETSCDEPSGILAYLCENLRHLDVF